MRDCEGEGFRVVAKLGLFRSTRLFARAVAVGVLDTEFDLADSPLLPEEQRYIRDERSFEFILARWNNIIVNEALRAASEYLYLENVCWIIGSLVLPGEDDAEPIMRPDWAAVTGRILSDLVLSRGRPEAGRLDTCRIRK